MGFLRLLTDFGQHENSCPNFDKIAKNKFQINFKLTVATINTKSINLPPISINYYKPVF